MNTLEAQRELVADLLREAGQRNVTSYLADRLVPPASIVTAGSPWIEAGDTYGTHKVRWVVTVSVPAGGNRKQTDDLEGLVMSAAVALADDFGLERVGEPYELRANSAGYLAADLTITTTDRLTTGE